MLRTIQLTALGGLMLLFAAGTPARAQDKTKLDRVSYLDPMTKMEVDLYGKIEAETPAGLKLKTREGKTDKDVMIPTQAVTRVYYYTPEVGAVEFNRGPVTEANWEKMSAGKKKDELFNTALEKYREAEKQLTKAEAKRYLQYRIAMMHARAAREKPEKAEEAVKLLKEFTAGNRDSWTIVPALTTQAQMLEEAGRPDEAREAYEALTTLDVPAGLKRQAQLSVGKLSLRAGKPADAQKHLQKLAASLSGADPEKPFVDAYLAEAQIGLGKLDGADAALTEVLKVSADPKLRGLVHNLLGDWCEKKSQPEDAFWHYLRVDALYNDEPEEHARALYRLKVLYDKVKKDPVRAGECERRLMGPAYDGTRYQKLGKADGYGKGEEEKKGS